MYSAVLRKVGGSVMLAVPPAILDVLNLRAGATVGVFTEGGRLIVEPCARPRHTLAALLAEVESVDPDQAWVDAPAAGRELI